MAEVRLHNINKLYPGGFHAVKNATLDIQDREFVVLVGPSGCGKSTTLRMIAGLEEISSGEITIGGRVVNDVPPKDRDIAMVFQNYALYPHMSVYKNMAFGLTLRKVPRAEIDRRVRDAASILGIEELLDRKPKALSGGQRQRVAVGRAIVRQPSAFLFDEPLSNLDAKMRVQMRTEIIRLHKRLEATMIYVTHDQVEAMTMGDRIVVMKDGVIQQVSAPLELYHNPANMFVAGFIGSPPMNFFHGTIRPGEQGQVFQGEHMALPLPPETSAQLGPHRGGDIVLGIRPEAIVDATRSDRSRAAPVLRATVDVTEQMGAEVLIYLRIGATTFISRMDHHDGAQPQATLDLAFDLSKARFFDPVTQQALS